MLAPEKLDTLLARFEGIEAEMASGPAPEVYIKLSRDYAELEPIVKSIRDLRKAEGDLEGAEALLSDPESDAEMKELAQLERDELAEVIEDLTQKVRIGLLPKDKADSRRYS